MKNSDVLKVLKKVKKSKSMDQHVGLCYMITSEFFKAGFYVPDKAIQYVIPEFNPQFFGLTPEDCEDDYWWNLSHRECRRKAIDLLISIYEFRILNGGERDVVNFTPEKTSFPAHEAFWGMFDK